MAAAADARDTSSRTANAQNATATVTVAIDTGVASVAGAVDPVAAIATAIDPESAAGAPAEHAAAQDIAAVVGIVTGHSDAIRAGGVT